MCQAIHLHKVEHDSYATDLFVERKTHSERVLLKKQIQKLENEKTELKDEVQRIREQKEDNIQEVVNENVQKLDDLHDKVDILVNKEKKVKNYQRGTVKGSNKGLEIEKFFGDMQQTKLGDRYDAAVLVSFHCPVDRDTPSMYPMVHKESQIPYMYIDNARDTADSSTFFKCCVNVMMFMINHVDNNQDPEERKKTLEDALQKTIKLQTKYQEHRKWYNSGKKPLDEMKNELDDLYLHLGGTSKTPRKTPVKRNQQSFPITTDPKRMKLQC
eukprot:GFUD01094490.1.p1 GENE.GFUD01094490.1~~GFUD01094490.1.p1  ORF type:complete len:295 (+),score=87.96 GFUD01094490.1:73-885(+)